MMEIINGFKGIRMPESIDDLDLVEILDVEFNIKSANVNGEIQLFDGAQMPSDIEITEARSRLLKKYQDNLYGKQRKEKYPKLEQQFDALWHDIDNGTLDKSGQFYNLIKTIKDQSPKT